MNNITIFTLTALFREFKQKQDISVKPRTDLAGSRYMATAWRRHEAEYRHTPDYQPLSNLISKNSGHLGSNLQRESWPFHSLVWRNQSQWAFLLDADPCCPVQLKLSGVLCNTNRARGKSCQFLSRWESAMLCSVSNIRSGGGMRPQTDRTRSQRTTVLKYVQSSLLFFFLEKTAYTVWLDWHIHIHVSGICSGLNTPGTSGPLFSHAT